MKYFVIYDINGIIICNVFADTWKSDGTTTDFYSDDNLVCFFYTEFISDIVERFTN